MSKNTYHNHGVPYWSPTETPPVRSNNVEEASVRTKIARAKFAWRCQIVAASIRLNWPEGRTFMLVDNESPPNVKIGIFRGVAQDRSFQWWVSADVYQPDGSLKLRKLQAASFLRDAFWPSGELDVFYSNRLRYLFQNRFGRSVFVEPSGVYDLRKTIRRTLVILKILRKKAVRRNGDTSES